MHPHPSVCHHPAYTMLLNYATNSCPVDCSKSWTIDILMATIQCGNHMSAQIPEVAKCLQEEALEKVQQGYAHIIKWDDVAQDLHPNVKISPLAAVQHKSHTYHAILDLSFQSHISKLKLNSINGTTNPCLLHQSMDQLGKVLPHFVHQIACTDPDPSPIYFAKWDIKDGFWHLVVSMENAWQFCYILPRVHKDNTIKLVVPTCLQMGWCKSPPLFCTTSKTMCNIAQELLDNTALLPPHKLKKLCIPDSLALPKLGNHQITKILQSLDVYVDNFIGLAAAPTHNDLLHFTQAVLHGIHKIFPTPDPNEQSNNKPISINYDKAKDCGQQRKRFSVGSLMEPCNASTYPLTRSHHYYKTSKQ